MHLLGHKQQYPLKFKLPYALNFQNANQCNERASLNHLIVGTLTLGRAGIAHDWSQAKGEKSAA